MHIRQSLVIPQWPMQSTTALGRLWASLPNPVRLLTYRLLRYVGKKIWPMPFFGGSGKQRLPFDLYCKFGGRIGLAEVLATMFVAANTTIPVPQILDVVYEGDNLFVLMTRVPGISAVDAIQPTDEVAWSLLEDDLRGWIRQLRSLAPPTQVVGSVLQTSLLQRRIDPRCPVGPWDNIATFHRYLVTLCPEDQGNDAYREFRRVAPLKIFSKNHRLCFTHGDLALHNLLAQNGRLSGMVDFECSGWFPEYWEYTGATFAKLGRWKKAVENIFGDEYREELEGEKWFWRANDDNF